ncbi:MAG: hypothetical protein L3J18_17055 [Candidatus Brocadia sp.]|nr:hypothetical protein [Candidatus Brocadia sp.]UJS20577.1 MAG: hypothetical protein L3J18_17055 [Candidatus Brocadia sp.]
MDKLCLSVLNYYKSQIVSLWSISYAKKIATVFYEETKERIQKKMERLTWNGK